MFENHFGFIRRPFTAGPDVQLFVNNDNAQTAFEAIDYCLRGGQGIAVLTAPSGTGKSMMCQVLKRELSEEIYLAFLPSPGSSSRLGLLQAIYFGLGKRVKRRHAGISDSEMRLELIDAVRGLSTKSTGLALLIDEAHLLDNEQLEEIRILSTFADSGQPLIRPLLCGAPSLEERLLDPELKALSQRIRCQVYLEPLTRDESELFIHHQLTRAGIKSRSIFEPEAMQMIVQSADGNARCLNQLCDQSLFIAAKKSEQVVTEDTVESALDTLVQLPLSWNRSLVSSRSSATTQSVPNAPVQTTSSTVESASNNESVIEFGSLDDDDFTTGSTVEFGAEEDTVEVGNSTETNEAWADEDTSVTIDLADPPVNTGVEVNELRNEMNTFETVGLVASNDDAILEDEPSYEPVAADDEELTETFRQGLPEAPIPFSQQPGAYGLVSETEVDEVLPVDDFVRLKPRFDGAVANEDLLPQSHSTGGGSNLNREPQTVAFGETARVVDDKWSQQATPTSPAFEEDDGVMASAEEQLLQSCIETRRDIATMLDTLEGHVSETLADRYDIVMPESGTGPEPTSLDSHDLERFNRVIDSERLH